MLDRLRKRLADLFSGGSSKPEPPPPKAKPSRPVVALPPRLAPKEPEARAPTRKETWKREARLILSERIHNRAATLKIELRNQLLQEIEELLEKESDSESLYDLLSVTLDPAFTQRLDTDIDRHTAKLVQTLQESFQAETASAALFPAAEAIADELKTYRDQLLRAHMLGQIEIYSLPSLTIDFDGAQASADELQQKITAYWTSCREAHDPFFRSDEMALLNRTRPGLRLDPSLIRERLLAGQFRNGYRAIEERFRSLYYLLAELQLNKPALAEERKPQLDRKIVDETIAPLAYFIHSGAEPEPREALAARAELLREVVDKLVAGGDPFPQVAEAVKPLLRQSIEQARSQALQNFPYLRSSIESLVSAEVDRATVLVQVLEVLLLPDISDQALLTVEQSIRLNRWQYHLHLQLWRDYPAQLLRLRPLERINAEDADFLTHFIEASAPHSESLEDVSIKLGYLEMPETLPKDPRILLRILAILTLSRDELGSCTLLYGSEPPSPEELARFAKSITQQLQATSAGVDDRQTGAGANPFPVEIEHVLESLDYKPEEPERLSAFVNELEALVSSGEHEQLTKAIDWIRKLQQAVEAERESLGLVGKECAPYVGEVWFKEPDSMVGLLFYRGPGFGNAPVERIDRAASEENRREVSEQLSRQLASQATIYQAFHRLFSRPTELTHSRRQALPMYLKACSENLEPENRNLFSHSRKAQSLVKQISKYAEALGQANHEAQSDMATVTRILGGLDTKLSEIQRRVAETEDPDPLSRLDREYERIVHLINIVILQSINPWLKRQTSGLSAEFTYREQEVEEAIRAAASSLGLDWKNDVDGFEAHRIHGTLGCRALLRLVDGSSKAVLLEYDRQRRMWQVKHLGPRVSDVLAEELRKHGRSLPGDYDEKYEQPTFSLEEQSCRFLLIKRNKVRLEATLVLESSQNESPWKVVYLKWNDEILVNRVNPLNSTSA